MEKKQFKIRKVLVTFCLAFLLIIQPNAITHAATASTLSVSGYSSLTTLKQGQAFVVKGTVTSNYKITKVTAYIATSSGTVKYTKSATPNATSYNLSGLDAAMRFDLLTAGSYVFKVDATDASSSASKNLLKQSFSVTSTSSITISGATKPSTLTVGDIFYVRGTITSTNKLTSVTGGVYTTSGTVKFAKTVNPNAATYNLAGIDNYMTFDTLGAGTYIYKITAKDSAGYSKTLVNVTFTVQEQTVTKGVADWLSSCKSLLNYYANNGFSYGTASPSYIGTKTTNARANCASFVSWCLYENGFVKNISDTNQFAQGVAAYVYDLGWEMNTDINNIKAGDIVYYNQSTVTETSRQSSINWLKTHNANNAGSGMHVDVCYNPSTRQFISAGSNSYITTGKIATYGTTYLSQHFVCSFRYPS